MFAARERGPPKLHTPVRRRKRRRGVCRRQIQRAKNHAEPHHPGETAGRVSLTVIDRALTAAFHPKLPLELFVFRCLDPAVNVAVFLLQSEKEDDHSCDDEDREKSLLGKIRGDRSGRYGEQINRTRGEERSV